MTAIPAQQERIAYQGEAGAFSEEALQRLRPQATPVPCRDFDVLFTSIDDGRADFILAPVSNSAIGAIAEVEDWLRKGAFEPLDGTDLRIEHHLIGLAFATIEQVRVARSRSAALQQCKRFFASHPQIRPEEADDTAGSVREMVATGDPSVAAIAGERAAKLYGGRILLRNIEDDPENRTRFVLFRRKAGA